MTLWDLQQGSASEVASLSDQLQANYRTRLIELGFKPGERITCVLAPRLGAPRLYQVDNTVFSLDDQLARHIQLHPAA